MGIFFSKEPPQSQEISVQAELKQAQELAEIRRLHREETQRLKEIQQKRLLAQQELEESQKLSSGTYFGPPTMFPNSPGLPIRPRGPIGPWLNVGIVYTKNPANNKMLTVEGQMVDIGRRRFRYRFLNPKTGIAVLYKNGKEVYEFTDGQEIPPITGMESLGPWIYQKSIY